MPYDEIKTVLKSAEYDFLRINEHLGSNVILLGLGGSHAYGTNVEGSDIDIRGIATHSKREILTGMGFEQVIDNRTDTTIFSLEKAIKLFLSCNPNAIEMLGLKPEQYFYLSDAGKLLVDNKKLFLSQRAINSFGGYASSQLKKLKHTDFSDINRKNKYIMHLIRLYLMVFDILEKEEINTYRENDRDFLLSARNGRFLDKNNNLSDELFSLINEYEERFKYDSKHTELPKYPNEEAVYDLIESINCSIVVK